MLSDLNKQQQAAVYFHVVAGCNDWHELYKIAEGAERYERYTEKSKKQTVSRFRHDIKILEAIQDLKYRLAQEKQKQDAEAVERWKSEDPEGGRGSRVTDSVNFLDRDEFLSFLNERANRISDDKQRNEILKMLSDNLRYKDAENSEIQEIQRFYTPLTCEDCPLYKDAANKIGTK